MIKYLKNMMVFLGVCGTFIISILIKTFVNSHYGFYSIFNSIATILSLIPYILLIYTTYKMLIEGTKKSIKSKNPNNIRIRK